MFKDSYLVQDLSIYTPSCDEFPNWKVRLLLKWMNFLFPLIWALCVDLFIDKMTM